MKDIRLGISSHFFIASKGEQISVWLRFESKYLTIELNYDDRLLRNFERIDSIVIQFVPDFLENSPTNSIIHQYVCDMYVY